jgi:hypothetical protein
MNGMGMRRAGRAAGLAWTAAAAFGVAAPQAGAQEDELPRATAAASPYLDVDHWAVRAASRAEALGLAPGFFPAQRGARRAEVSAAL